MGSSTADKSVRVLRVESKIPGALKKSEWAQAEQLSKSLGIDIEDMREFIVRKMKNQRSSPLSFPSDEERTPVSPLSLASDYDIKSNGLDTKHSVFDDSKERFLDSKSDCSVSWDAKHHRFVSNPSQRLDGKSGLDNKHGFSDGKGRLPPPTSSNSLWISEGKRQDDYHLVNSMRFGSPRLNPCTGVFSDTSTEAIGGIGDIPGISNFDDISSLPDCPDFGFSSDDEDTVTNAPKSVDFKREPAPPKPQVYLDGGSSVLQIDARHSVMGAAAVAKMKRAFYRKSLAAGWKRQRGEAENKSDSSKRLRSAQAVASPSPLQLFSEELVRSFANRIVDCPICREPSHVGGPHNVRH
uniref:Uncharacterized protein n=1 Tax=Lotharella globosa TaxID=91324 RepID=A0A7S3Z9A3_9EUKA